MPLEYTECRHHPRLGRVQQTKGPELAGTYVPREYGQTPRSPPCAVAHAVAQNKPDLITPNRTNKYPTCN
jgi:hypothetical protein